MSDRHKILDEIAEAKGINTDLPLPKKPKTKIEQLPQKLAILGIVIGIYACIMVGLFVTSNLVFLLALVVYFILIAPLTRLLKRIFKIKEKSDLQ